MANELVINYTTGLTLYALLFNSTGQVWNGAAFEACQAANWTDYDIAMTEVATTGVYLGTMPVVAAGAYAFAVRRQAGVNPAVGDVTAGAGELLWTGTAEDSTTNSALATLIGDVPTNAELTNALAALNDITVADIIAGVSEGSLDLQEMLRIMLAAVAGKSSGGGTATIKFRDQGDTKDRITATVDANGNRAAVSVDAS